MTSTWENRNSRRRNIHGGQLISCSKTKGLIISACEFARTVFHWHWRYSRIEDPPTSLLRVEAYCKAPSLTLTEDPLKWWRVHEVTFPLFSQLSKRYLCIPGVSAERVFSTAGDVVTAKRSTLKPEHVDQLVFLKKNLQIPSCLAVTLTHAEQFVMFQEVSWVQYCYLFYICYLLLFCVLKHYWSVNVVFLRLTIHKLVVYFGVLFNLMFIHLFTFKCFTSTLLALCTSNIYFCAFGSVAPAHVAFCAQTWALFDV